MLNFYARLNLQNSFWNPPMTTALLLYPTNNPKLHCNDHASFQSPDRAVDSLRPEWLTSLSLWKGGIWRQSGTPEECHNMKKATYKPKEGLEELLSHSHQRE